MPSNTTNDGIETDVSTLVEKARIAQAQIENYSQKEVDGLVTDVCWVIPHQDRAEQLAKLAVDEGSFGNYSDKVSKIRIVADIA